MKICPKCQIEKQIKDFSKDSSRTSGRGSHCKKCTAIRANKYYRAHQSEREKYRQKNKKRMARYYQVHKRKASRKAKDYYRIHKEEIKERSKQYYTAHKVEQKIKRLEYRELNKQKRAEYNKKYYQTLRGKEIKRNGRHKRRTAFIITDSGGIQEEAISLNKPVLVAREITERPEGIKIGAAKLVGSNSAIITEEAVKLVIDQDVYKSMINKKNPYGDGHASQKIVDYLLKI